MAIVFVCIVKDVLSSRKNGADCALRGLDELCFIRKAFGSPFAVFCNFVNRINIRFEVQNDFSYVLLIWVAVSQCEWM